MKDEEGYFGIPKHWGKVYRNKEYELEKHEPDDDHLKNYESIGDKEKEKPKAWHYF